VLIATFRPTTVWVGVKITCDGTAFVLEGHGPITAGDVMEYDRQGLLAWVNEGARAWVGSKARGAVRPAASATASVAADSTVSPARERPAKVGGQPLTLRQTYLKRALLVCIAVLIVTNAILFLALLGVLPSL
jgi:hypothetical protein